MNERQIIKAEEGDHLVVCAQGSSSPSDSSLCFRQKLKEEFLSSGVILKKVIFLFWQVFPNRYLACLEAGKRETSLFEDGDCYHGSYETVFGS